MAQSQYDPLVLLSAYLIKSKLLMKKVTQGTGAKGWDEAMEGVSKITSFLHFSGT
jgi:hypothetical protein